jgi:GT2 family glycosyltransferase
MPDTLIQCVIVLYKQSPWEARSLSTLLGICAQSPEIAGKIHIAVQDNSPEPPLAEFCPSIAGFTYFRAPNNPGLAVAYGRALAMARDKKIPWLLTLDQDTVLVHDFLIQLLSALESDISQQASAVVPELVHDNLVLSPQIVRAVFYHRIPLGFFGFAKEQVVAFNSAACLNVEALTAIGGFPKEYWLDYLDHIVFYRLQSAGGRVYILNSQLKHNLSLQNLESEVSVERYSSILKGEWRYIRESRGSLGPLIHRIRLLKRAMGHALHLQNKRYSIQTLLAAIQGKPPQ